MKEKITTINPIIKEAVYIGITAVSFFHVAKYLKVDTSLALVFAPLVAKILTMDKNNIHNNNNF